MIAHRFSRLSRILAVAALASVTVAASAKSARKAKPAQMANSTNSSDTSYASRWDFFAGYSYLAPHATVNTPMPNGVTVPTFYSAINEGAIGSAAYYFNKYIGGQFEYANHPDGPGDGAQDLGGGLILRAPTENITPFVHALAGAVRLGGPNVPSLNIYHGYTWGPAVTIGGGMDYNTPFFNHHLGIRLFQADYQYYHVNFGRSNQVGGRANVNAARLSAGLVIHAGSIAPPPPVTLACSANPESVFPGEKITITATAGNLNPKQNVIYSWSGNGVSGSGNTATVDTTNLAPGSYTAQGTVKEGKKGKEGLKPWQTANCTANFTVKEFEPPTISCSANPSTIKPGETSTITCDAVSPQNRPLTYSYKASEGTISGSGNTAEFSSAGAPTGAVEVTGTVNDDKGHSASANTTVTIEAPPPPPQPKTQALCSLSFSTDTRRPMRVDNQAKACLDQVALDLKQQADAKAVLVGNATSKEQALEAKQEKRQARYHRAKVDHFAAQRAVNAKDYLVTEQGIDASRISVATGTDDSQTVQDYLVPAGANFAQDVPGTTPVDETAIKPQTRKALPMRHHAAHHSTK